MNEREKKLNDLLDNLNDKLDKALALKARQKMGMTIDEAINHGQEQLEIFGGEHREFIKTAIDTMRKYQKIEQIIDDWNNEKINNIICCLDIKEVVNNGKID